MDKQKLPDNTNRKPRRWLRWTIEILVIVAIIFGVRAYQQRDMIDGIAPNFERGSLNGSVVRLSDYQGKPHLLHFWASWCPMCEFEQGSISAIAKDHPIITVAFQSGNSEEVQRYMERKEITEWITVVDEDGKLSEQYGIHGVPTTYVLDAQGNIRFREVGLTSGWGLRLRLWLTDVWYTK
ncbi:protein disulfide oxidoreductase [Candidatus Thiothrix anitrata]|jgi:peroxiredoxin|uniref:Protein disulfide oxidoreductase n=1 Tax=Candidatus Thiothrix anitrata TaxID=2823902 RepID=A0ABX7X3S7_9GAMM|nr:protein disulfide oxidoreductase [Candidatus Thiothrix anitrata]QTR50052.1 protein disulfide oxidoreductase [Candidatus Thiothrix anitrata]